MKHICIITPGYPNEDNSTVYAFVSQLALAIADLGYRIDVISPAVIWDQKKKRPVVWNQTTKNGTL